MAYPEILTYANGLTASDTSHAVSYPANIAIGDLVLVLFVAVSNPTVTAPAGWTQLAADTDADGFGPHYIGYRIAASALAGTVSFTTNFATTGAYFCARISGTHPIISAIANDNSVSPNSGSLASTFDAGQELLWLSLFTYGDAVTARSVTGFPANFADNNLWEGAASAPLWGAASLESTTTPQDPDAFTISAAQRWSAYTLAIADLRQYIDPDIIPTGELFYTVTIEPGNVDIEPDIIPTAEEFFATCSTFFYPHYAPGPLCFPMISSSGLGLYPDIIAAIAEVYAPTIEAGEGCVNAKISNVSYPMRNGSLRIEDTISERSTAEFIIKDLGGAWEFERGEVVRIWDRFSQIAFVGVIHSSQRYRVTEGYFEHYIVCADNHYFADKRVAAQAYLNMSAGNIVRDLILDYLADEGITEGVIEAGPTVIETIFNYISVSEAMDELATLAGFWWAIDIDKKLYFVNPDYHSLSFGMTGSEMQRGTVSVTNMNPKYRNRQYVKGGKAITDLQTEIQFGDGSKQAFAVRYPIARVPTVEVSTGGGAWTAQTVGIKGLDTGFDWYWSKGDLVLAQEIADAPLDALDRLRVQYFGQWPIVTISQRNDEVARMLALQGGSGRVEDVVQDAQIDTREAAFQLANSNLSKYSQNSIRIQFDTLQYGLEVGRLVNIVLPDYGIDDNFLIERLEIWQDAQLMWYRAHCLEGPSEGTWQSFFAEIARRGRPQIDKENIGEDEVLITLVSISEAISWGEGTTVTPIACPICGVGTLCGVGTIVC